MFEKKLQNDEQPVAKWIAAQSRVAIYTRSRNDLAQAMLTEIANTCHAIETRRAGLIPRGVGDSEVRVKELEHPALILGSRETVEILMRCPL